MLHGIYSIKDLKSETHNPPFFQKNTGEACRTFSKICTDPNSMLNQYPEDFILVTLGQFDDETGELIPVNPTAIGSASQYVKNS